jgi:hypothetical protein
MARFAWLLLLPLAACAAVPADPPPAAGGYAGIVQKVVRVVRRGADLPGMGLLGQLGGRLGSMLRQNEETHQYVVRTPRGQIIAQSDDEFPVGECVEVIPQTDRSGPAFRYGEAQVVRSDSCRG